MRRFEEFKRQRSAFQRAVRVEVAFVEMCRGDPAAALLLAHIVDLPAPPVQASPENIVRGEYRNFIPMRWDSVWAALRIPRRRRETALRHLKELGLVFSKVRKVDGVPTLHVALNESLLMAGWDNLLNGRTALDWESE